MYTVDYGTVQLLYEDRLREAERNRRLLYLTLDMNSQTRLEGANSLVQVIKQWLAARSQHRAAGDISRPRVV